MLRIEDLNKRSPYVLSYIDSTGTFDSTHEENVENGGIMGKSKTGTKIDATYFFVPLMVFPTYVEIVSATLGYENDTADVVVKLIHGKKGEWNIKKPEIVHKKGECITTVFFNNPVLINPLECFYFSCNKKLEKSRIVVGYKTF